jgi:hypothetical protein
METCVEMVVLTMATTMTTTTTNLTVKYLSSARVKIFLTTFSQEGNLMYHNLLKYIKEGLFQQRDNMLLLVRHNQYSWNTCGDFKVITFSFVYS